LHPQQSLPPDIPPLFSGGEGGEGGGGRGGAAAVARSLLTTEIVEPGVPVRTKGGNEEAIEGGRADERTRIRYSARDNLTHTQVTEEEQAGLLSALSSFVSSRRSSSFPSSRSSSPPFIDAVAVMGSLPSGVPSTFYAKVRIDGKEEGRVSDI